MKPDQFGLPRVAWNSAQIEPALSAGQLTNEALISLEVDVIRLFDCLQSSTLPVLHRWVNMRFSCNAFIRWIQNLTVDWVV